MNLSLFDDSFVFWIKFSKTPFVKNLFASSFGYALKLIPFGFPITVFVSRIVSYCAPEKYLQKKSCHNLHWSLPYYWTEIIS